MTWEQYWFGPAWMVEAFLESDRKTQERQNEAAWLQGLYIYDAVSCVLSNAFGKKGSKKAKYPEKPYALGGKKEETQAQKESREEQEALRAKAYMLNMIRQGKHWGQANGRR